MKIEILTLPEIRHVYRHLLKYDFPDDERKPLSRIEKSLERGQYLCYGMKDGAGTAAYAFFVVIEDVYLLDYYAVRKDLRSSGIGSGFLEELNRSCFGEAVCVLVEVDDPSFAGSEEEKTVRERRLAFYLRNGLLDTGACARTFGADFRILEFPLGEPHSEAEAGAFYSQIYRSLLPKRIYEQMVKIS